MEFYLDAFGNSFDSHKVTINAALDKGHDSSLRAPLMNGYEALMCL
jgi:hypothetical protein